MSEKIKIKLPDGSEREYEKGVSGLEIAGSIGAGLAKAALAIEVDGEVKDLSYKLEKDADFKIFTFRDNEGKEIFRHSTAHILADAVTRLFPKAKLTIGPPIEDGFYYDFDKDTAFTESDLEKIEVMMKTIVDEDHAFQRLDNVKKDDATKKIKETQPDNPYKLELINELGDAELSFYSHGKFIDLCKGPHIPRTGIVKAFKLTKMSGAYWRGDAKNKQLHRIYGVAFPEKKELKKYLHMLEEASKRDHRKLGKELDLISFQEESPGAVFYHPKGAVIYRELQEFIGQQYRRRGFSEVVTPLVYDKSLWETSGHWKHYKDDMFVFKVDGREVSLKPMNCPSHCLIYKTNTRSYKDLPLRIADFASLHRNELRGALGGMTRVRKFNQDDAHIFCRADQLEHEIDQAIDFANHVYNKTFDVKYSLELSTRPEKSLGTDEMWEKAETALKNALDKNKMEYKINPGDGAFYGPKIDLHMHDSLGRSWQLSTIQVDFNLPERFELAYEGSDGKKHRPVMIHRAVLGTLDRFMGIMIEHFAGKFPLWMSPIQVRLMTVAQKFEPYANELKEMFFDENIRVEVDNRAESIPKKVRQAQLDKVPIMLTIGEKEVNNKTVALRTLDGQVKFGLDSKELLQKVVENIKKRKLKFEI